MKKLIISALSLLSYSAIYAQQCNPYVLQGTVSPGVLYDAASNGIGQLSFQVGNNGIDDMPLISDQEMVLMISLSRGAPNHMNPIDAISGSFANKFDWMYDAITKSFMGRQNQLIAAGASGTITIDYKVISNSLMGSPQNGLNVNITPPAYANGDNNMIDDQLSVYTWTEPQVVIQPNGEAPVKTDLHATPLSTPTEVVAPADPVIQPDVKEGDNIATNDISIYPNPAVDYINIRINATQKEQYHIQVLDANLKMVAETESMVDKGSKTVRISTSHLAEGNYNVKITHGKESKTILVTKLRE